MDAADRAARIVEDNLLLRAWGQRLLPAVVEADIFSRCAAHDLRIAPSTGRMFVGLDRKTYIQAVQSWSPLHHGGPCVNLPVRAPEPEPAHEEP